MTAHLLRCVALLWIAGIGLRLTILAVPPVIPAIHDDLRMSATQVGILSGLPPVLFAFAALAGSLLIARFGALPTLLAGLVATGIGSALRGAAADVIVLYAMTIVTGFGVAIMQPALPPLVRTWMPERIGFGTAVYANGLLVGEILPVALTLPLLLPLLGGSWRLSFVAWGAIAIVLTLAIAVAAPRIRVDPKIVQPARLWWPDWRSGLLWRIGLILGTVNAAYFSTNGFLPDYLHQIGRGDLIAPALTSLNVAQLPASFLLLAFAGRYETSAFAYAACGVLCLAGVLGIVFGSGVMIVIAAGVLGFSTAAVLILSLAVPPLLCRPDDVPRMAAGVFVISYSCAVIAPVISGAVWDLTGVARTAFLPIGFCALALIVLPLAWPFERRAVQKV